jgi:hypothetical protein
MKKRRNQCHAYKGKKANDLMTKEGNSFKSSIFRVEVVISAKHISSAPTGESSSTVELQIGGAATPEWVWWSRSPAKHALIKASLFIRLGILLTIKTLSCLLLLRPSITLMTLSGPPLTRPPCLFIGLLPCMSNTIL